MGFKATVKVDMSGAKAKIRSICSNPEVGRFAATDVKRLANQYVPMMDSILRKSVVISPFLLTYTAPYAHYQWEGVSRSGKKLNYRTSGTTSHWTDNIDKGELARDITEFLRRL